MTTNLDPVCQHRGKLHQWGDHPDVFYCLGGKSVCTLAPSGMKTAVGDVADCENCSVRTESAALPEDLEWLVCPHRGSATGSKVSANGCGCDRQLYQCEIKGTCLKKLPSGRTLESFGEQLAGVSICTECDIPRELEAES